MLQITNNHDCMLRSDCSADKETVVCCFCEHDDAAVSSAERALMPTTEPLFLVSTSMLC